jgi:hypothetical protein
MGRAARKWQLRRVHLIDGVPAMPQPNDLEPPRRSRCPISFIMPFPKLRGAYLRWVTFAEGDELFEGQPTE